MSQDSNALTTSVSTLSSSPTKEDDLMTIQRSPNPGAQSSAVSRTSSINVTIQDLRTFLHDVGHADDSVLEAKLFEIQTAITSHTELIQTMIGEPLLQLLEQYPHLSAIYRAHPTELMPLRSYLKEVKDKVDNRERSLKRLCQETVGKIEGQQVQLAAWMSRDCYSNFIAYVASEGRPFLDQLHNIRRADKDKRWDIMKVLGKASFFMMLRLTASLSDKALGQSIKTTRMIPKDVVNTGSFHDDDKYNQERLEQDPEFLAAVAAHKAQKVNGVWFLPQMHIDLQDFKRWTAGNGFEPAPDSNDDDEDTIMPPTPTPQPKQLLLQGGSSEVATDQDVEMTDVDTTETVNTLQAVESVNTETTTTGSAAPPEPISGPENAFQDTEMTTEDSTTPVETLAPSGSAATLPPLLSPTLPEIEALLLQAIPAHNAMIGPTPPALSAAVPASASTSELVSAATPLAGTAPMDQDDQEDSSDDYSEAGAAEFEGFGDVSDDATPGDDEVDNVDSNDGDSDADDSDAPTKPAEKKKVKRALDIRNPTNLEHDQDLQFFAKHVELHALRSKDYQRYLAMSDDCIDYLTPDQLSFPFSEPSDAEKVVWMLLKTWAMDQMRVERELRELLNLFPMRELVSAIVDIRRNLKEHQEPVPCHAPSTEEVLEEMVAIQKRLQKERYQPESLQKTYQYCDELYKRCHGAIKIRDNIDLLGGVKVTFSDVRNRLPVEMYKQGILTTDLVHTGILVGLDPDVSGCIPVSPKTWKAFQEKESDTLLSGFGDLRDTRVRVVVVPHDTKDNQWALAMIFPHATKLLILTSSNLFDDDSKALAHLRRLTKIFNGQLQWQTLQYTPIPEWTVGDSGILAVENFLMFTFEDGAPAEVDCRHRARMNYVKGLVDHLAKDAKSWQTTLESLSHVLE